ncbi:amidohydrolase [Haloglomus litoreum]|uniref:amidohydrolase n=1 Tax=Haloglomus litoreum TaxID=3034026 RepID=UPI0023E8C332|nr:amidohydrolase [Haloglomus sp. DT116]
MLELEHGFRVVDVGATLVGEPGGSRGRAVAPDRLERELRQAGVVRAVVAPPSRPNESGYLAANNAVARRSVDRPFVPFARLSGPRVPGDPPDERSNPGEHPDTESVAQYGYDDRFHGFAIDPTLDGLPTPGTLDALGDVGLPVLVTGGHGFPPSRVADLCGRGFPVVLGGVGGDPGTRELFATAVDLLERHDDLFLDTGTVRSRAHLERALREHPDRVLFASRAGEAHPNVAVMTLLTCSVPEDTMGRAFDGNPSRVVPSLAP